MKPFLAVVIITALWGGFFMALTAATDTTDWEENMDEMAADFNATLLGFPDPWVEATSAD